MRRSAPLLFTGLFACLIAKAASALKVDPIGVTAVGNHLAKAGLLSDRIREKEADRKLEKAKVDKDWAKIRNLSSQIEALKKSRREAREQESRRAPPPTRSPEYRPSPRAEGDDTFWSPELQRWIRRVR